MTKQEYKAMAEAAKLAYVQGGGTIMELAPQKAPKQRTAGGR